MANESDVRRLAGQVKQQAATIKVLQAQHLRQQRINNLHSLFDDVITNVTLWQDYARAVDREYTVAFDGHIKALAAAKRTFQANAAARQAWKQIMVDLVMIGLGGVSGGGGGVLLAQLVGSKSPGGLLAADANPASLAAIQTLGEDLIKAGAGQLASQLEVGSARQDVFSAVAGENPYETISFLKPLEIQLNKLVGWVASLKRLKLEERTDMDEWANKIDAAIRRSPILTQQPPSVEIIQDKFRANLERNMWSIWVLTLDRRYWQRIRTVLKMHPEERRATANFLRFSRPDAPMDDTKSFEAIRDRMISSRAFTAQECSSSVRWVPFNTADQPFTYRAVILADVIDIALRELPLAELPVQLRVEAVEERKRAQAEAFNKRMNIAACAAPSSPAAATALGWRSYLPGYVR